MVLDLKGIREAAKLGQADLGKRLELSQAQISRYEAEPQSISMDWADRWCEACGTSIDAELVKAKRQAREKRATDGSIPGLEVGEPYVELHRKLSLLEQYVAEIAPEIDPSLPPVSMTPQDLLRSIRQWKRKPTVLIAGRFDSGKTRIANAFLGGNKLPSQYQPATSVVTYIRHVADRPAWQEDAVWVLKKDFNPSDWENEEACNNHKVISGGFETLRKFGIRESAGDDLGAKYALVYMDSPLLNACTLIDVPGFSERAKDDGTEPATAANTDILIYTSPAKGFMDERDFVHLGLLLRSLPAVHARGTNRVEKYTNLFIVATHADPYISDEELQEILAKGSSRLYTQLKDSVLKNKGLTETELPDRFRTFWYETQYRRDALEDGLRRTLARVMPAKIEKLVDESIKDIKSKAKDSFAAQITAYEKTLGEYEAARQAIVQLRSHEPELRKRVSAKKEEVSERIEALRAASIAFVRDQIAPTVSAESVEAFIRKDFSDKNDAKKGALTKLLADSQSKLEDFLRAQSQELNSVIEDFLKEYNDSVWYFESAELGNFSIPFDTVEAFLSGLAGLGTLGALGFWASTVGNLGGYILVAKLASVLSAVGLGVSSVGFVSFVAATGGPVAWGIGLAILTAWGVWSLLGAFWQRGLAKKMAKTLEETQFLRKCEESVNTFWEQTWKAFEAGADAIDKKFYQYLLANEQLLDDAKGGSRERIEATIRSLEGLRDFFAEIPWRSPV
jgi:transcriptional regulator with XRE-family HTH domain